MSDLFAPVCSIAPTRRRRFLWAAWWTAPPVREPFRKPDAHAGGARTREQALWAAERAAGRPLVEIDSSWARAWSRILLGRPAWPRRSSTADVGAAQPVKPKAGAQPSPSAWSLLGVSRDASADEIKRAFRTKALETHPDRGGSEEAFRAVHRAYERAMHSLGRPKRRKRR